jgi:two-component system, cell cycle sensor histidine kinase and response regulator CckA
MPHVPDPRAGLLSDLAAIEQRIARSTSESAANESLDWGEKRYRHLVENSLGLICTHDLEGIVLSVNPAAANSLGYEPRDGIGRNLREFLSPGTRHRFDQYLARIREHAHDSGVMRVVRKDGTERLWLYRNVLYVEPGVRPYVLGHAIDVTERATAEAAVRRSHARTLEATSRLAGRVAHAFNNLLTVIIGSTEMLIADPSSDARTRARLDAIMRAAARGASVTQQLLAVGRQQPIDHTALDLNAVVAKLEPSLRHVLGNAILTLSLDPALPHIDGDSAQIEQVLLHLAGNAAEAMADGGTIAIETSPTMSDDVRARNHPDVDSGDCVWLTVRDTGCGMDAHTREHLFEPFFTTKSTGLSAGLGLPVVYGIVHQLGGTIDVDSELGKGTTVTIALKRATVVYGSREAADSTIDANVKGSRTIVLVDDEDDVRSVMRSVLQQKGYTVLDAASGAEAIRLLANHTGPVDMLVSDVVMPGMSGRELYEHLARRHPGLKVLFVTGYADDAFGREPGWGTALLSKPFSLETLAQRVQDELDNV